MEKILDRLVEQAIQGDKDALEKLVKSLQGPIFGLSLRMLYHPQDAEDATQEILVKVITHLGGFRGEASLKVWAMKIATNHLLSVRRRRGREAVSFDEMADRIVADWPAPWEELEAEPLKNLMVEEFRIACLQVVLLGLDRPHRLTYILGEVLDVSGKEGGQILGISAAAFRKRLQRARTRIQGFLTTHCSLIRPGNPCLCERQTDFFLSRGDLDRDNLVFADHPCRLRHDPSTLDRLRELDELSRIGVLIKQNADFLPPQSFVDHLRKLIDSKEFQIL